MQFGQFMDHDFTNTPMATTNSGGFLSCKDCNSQQTISNECRPIRVPQGDPIMAANDRNGAPLCLSFTRSMSRTGIDGRRQQVNQLTSFLDASVVYGSSACLTRRLRSFSNGRSFICWGKSLTSCFEPNLPSAWEPFDTVSEDVNSQSCTSIRKPLFGLPDSRAARQAPRICKHHFFYGNFSGTAPCPKIGALSQS